MILEDVWALGKFRLPECCQTNARKLSPAWLPREFPSTLASVRIVTRLPKPPHVALEPTSSPTDGTRPPFLRVRHLHLEATYPNGRVSEPFTYDVVDRRALDAVVIIAHFEDGESPHVLLRSAIRPALQFRAVGGAESPNLWELPAGLIEQGETPEETASRELLEEVGIERSPAAFSPLGPWAFPAAGMIGERHVFLRVAIDRDAAFAPEGDGSALEREAELVAMSADALVEASTRGELRDEKTELGLRRFLDWTRTASGRGAP